MDKQYISRFVANLEIDLPNYITESLILNYIQRFRLPKPNSPFWREGLKKESNQFAELTKRYQIELVGVNQLLEIYSPSVIMKVITDGQYFAFKMLKKENRGPFLHDLLDEQIEYYRTLDAETRNTNRKQLDKREFVNSKTASKNPISKLL